MPGVPSSKGCEGCRKQKKKCDEAKPSCSRCRRLRIPCIGVGIQRYKFQIQTSNTRSSEIVRVPGNQVTLLTKSFIEKIQVEDVRFSLSFLCGSIIDEIPKRLGSNAALDAASKALTNTFKYRCTQARTPEVLSSYIDALKCLRECVGDPRQAGSANTLCALYLVWVCQGSISVSNDHEISHGKGTLSVLEKGLLGNWHGPFEQELLLILGAALIVESIYNPQVYASPAILRICHGEVFSTIYDNDVAELNELQLGELLVQCLHRMPKFLRDPDTENEAAYVYEKVRAAVPRLNQFLTVDFEKAEDLVMDDLQHTIIATRLRVLGLALLLALLVNFVLRTYQPDSIQLFSDFVGFQQQMLDVARQADRYRPLGTGHMPAYLMVAWAVQEDGHDRADVETIMEIYQQDMVGCGIMVGAVKLQQNLARFQRLVQEKKILNSSLYPADVSFDMIHK